MQALSMKKLLFDVLSTIQPGNDELKSEKVFTKKLVRTLQRSAGRNAKAVLAGSMAKGTFLRQDKDIDVFLLFPRSIKKENFAGIVKKITGNAFPDASYKTKYAEHPYLRMRIEGKNVDVVPAYKVNKAENLKSAVDRSVFHTEFIVRKLERSRIKEVLLLKKFLKCNELYGAEIRVGGFSGYLCELMIVKFGSFLNFLRVAIKWKGKEPVFIDITRQYKGKEEKEKAMKRFNTKFIVIDPTDRNRNVAAAVSPENLRRLIKTSKSFLKKPTARYFSAPKSFGEKIEIMRRDGISSYMIVFHKENVADDIIWGQIRKVTNALRAYMEKNEFDVNEVLMDCGEKRAVVAINISKEKLPDRRELKGPKTDMKEHTAAFVKAHKNARFKTRNGRMIAIVPREMIYAKDAIRGFFRKTVMPTHMKFVRFSEL